MYHQPMLKMASRTDVILRTATVGRTGQAGWVFPRSAYNQYRLGEFRGKELYS